MHGENDRRSEGEGKGEGVRRRGEGSERRRERGERRGER